MRHNGVDTDHFYRHLVAINCTHKLLHKPRCMFVQNWQCILNPNDEQSISRPWIHLPVCVIPRGILALTQKNALFTPSWCSTMSNGTFSLTGVPQTDEPDA